MKCRSDKSDLIELFSLGNIAVSDFVVEQPQILDKPPLTLMFSERSKLLQLSESVDPSKMYGKYWYRSGTNNSMRIALKDVVDSCLHVKKTNNKSLWLDIASNDGTLLSFVPSTMTRVGIDPGDNSFTDESKKHADTIIQSLFSAEEYQKQYSRRKCDIITCIAMFYDLDDPTSFLNDIHTILDDDGLFVMQLSYTPLMIQQNAFDNICHEHICYYTLFTLKTLLDKTGFIIRDCQLNDVNGGSFRIYIQKSASSPSSFGTAPYRDVCNFRVKSLLKYEEEIGANTKEFYLRFFNRILELKEKVTSFIKNVKSQGKSVWVYGASTKGNTLLQWFGLDHTLIDGAAERSPYKFGMKTIATDIPIYSEEYMRSQKPDYLLILPWHFIDEFSQRESEYLRNGGTFIVPCPKFDVI